MANSPISSPLYLKVVTVIVIVFGLSAVMQVRAAAVAQFVFGDSLVDQGNNNNLQSIAKANFKPNGIDFASSNYQPTGRFCNGRLISDFLSEYMGTSPILAYNDAAANGANLLRGCNFGSAGSGILDDTGSIFIQRLTLTQQLQDFQNVQSQINSMLGPAGASQLIADAIFAFTTGGNDYINNYLLPGSPRSQQYSINQFTQLLISTFEGQLRTLYSYGARKISVANIGPIGCIPDQLQSKSESGACVDSVNQLAIGFNQLLQPMLVSLNQQLPGVTITYSDSYSMVNDFIKNPSQYGFTSSTNACCGTGRFNGLIPCSVVTSLCTDRDQYLFWDPFHPTEKANEIAVQRLLFGPTSDISPMHGMCTLPTLVSTKTFLEISQTG